METENISFSVVDRFLCITVLLSIQYKVVGLHFEILTTLSSIESSMLPLNHPGRIVALSFLLLLIFKYFGQNKGKL